MNYERTLRFARELDRTDPLRAFRERFAMPVGKDGTPLVYLCGHSLGPMPLTVRAEINQELDDWATLAVMGHEHARRPWIPYHENLTSGLQHLCGAQANEVVAMNSLTINLHLMLATFFKPQGRRRKLVIEAGAFPSDRHAVVGQLEWHGISERDGLVELAPREGEDLVREEDFERWMAAHGDEVALVLWPGIQYRTAQAFDVGRIVRAGHRAGAIVGFDLAHAIGNIPLTLHDDDADFAVWCSYKYLNAGPGAIGGAFVHERHAEKAPGGRLAGWWGHEIATRFLMEPGFRAEHGAAGWQVSNPPVLAAAPLIASLKMFEEAGMDRLREKSLALTGYLEFLLAGLGEDVRLVTSSEPAARGCQLSFRLLDANARPSSARGRGVFEWLLAREVICDWREPDIIRISPIPLYNTFEDVFRCGEQLEQALREIA